MWASSNVFGGPSAIGAKIEGDKAAYRAVTVWSGSCRMKGAIMGFFSQRPAEAMTDMCACGHAREAHQHYRRGNECSICDARRCSSFTALATAAQPAADRAARNG